MSLIERKIMNAVFGSQNLSWICVFPHWLFSYYVIQITDVSYNDDDRSLKLFFYEEATSLFTENFQTLFVQNTF